MKHVASPRLIRLRPPRGETLKCCWKITNTHCNLWMSLFVGVLQRQNCPLGSRPPPRLPWNRVSRNRCYRLNVQQVDAAIYTGARLFLDATAPHPPHRLHDDRRNSQSIANCLSFKNRDDGLAQRRNVEEATSTCRTCLPLLDHIRGGWDALTFTSVPRIVTRLASWKRTAKWLPQRHRVFHR